MKINLKFFQILLIVILFFCSSAIAQNNVIGNPIKIGSLLVAQYDFPNKMNWEDATKSCSSLGNGWRLPTKIELNILYSNLSKIGDVGDDGYWTSTGNGIERAWRQYLFKEGYSYDDVKYGSGFVRAVGNYGVVKVTPTKARNTKPVQNNQSNPVVSNYQIRLSTGDLCDNGNGYKNKSVRFSYSYSDAEQLGGQWSLRSQSRDYETINSSVKFGLAYDNDKFYTRIMFADCKIILRIPYSMTVPNVTNSYINVAGTVTGVGNSFIVIEVSQILRAN